MKKLLILLILMMPLKVLADLTGTEGLAIDLSSAGAGTDFTIAFDPTELFGNRTWGDASTDTIVWTWNRATGTDPTITFNSGSLGLMAISLSDAITLSDAATIDQSANNYITLAENSDTFQFYFDATDIYGIWSDGALNLQNAEDTDAIVNILGKDAGEKGILRVLSDGDDKYTELYHDDTDGYVSTSSGDLYLVANGGDIQLGNENIVTTGLIIMTPGGVGSSDVISVTPSAAISTNEAVWNAFKIVGTALDPSGDDIVLCGVNVDMSGVVFGGTGGDIDGIGINMTAGEDHAIHISQGKFVVENTVAATAGAEFTIFDMQVHTAAMHANSSIHAIDVATPETPAGTVVAVGTHSNVEVIQQSIGTFSIPNQTEYAGEKHTGGTVWADGVDASEVFIVDDDEVYVGSVAQFSEIDVIMTTPGSKTVTPTFHYNTAADTWTEFFPADDTDGFQQSGIIRWTLGDISGSWTNNGDPGGADSSAGYWIKIIRTANADPGTPTPTTVKTGAITTYFWDKTGAIDVLSIDADTLTDGTATLTGGALTGLTTALTVAQGGTGATSLNDGFVLLGSNTGAITPLDVTTDGGIIIGDGTTDPVVLDVGSSTAITILGTIATGVWQGTAIADAYVPDNITIDLATLATTVTITDNESTAENNPVVFVAGAAQAGGSLGLESDGTYYYTPSTGTVTTTEFVGGGSGLTAIDAATGDSATAFFDAGTIEHEYGGLEADISGYTGLVAITGGSTAEVDDKSELEGHIADVADFAEADGDTWTGTHDLSGATVTMPKRTKNDDRFYAFNAWNPNALYDTDTQLCIDPNLPAAITITEVTVTLDADPTTELDWDLKWADAFIGLGNAALVVAIDTTSGTTDVDSGFDDATVAAGKCLYIEFAADPDSNITQAMVKIRYDYD